MRLPLLAAAYLLIAAAATEASTISAGIAAVSGGAEIVVPPSSVRRQAYESDAAVRVFLERETLAPSVPVNAVQPGVYNAYADFNDQTLHPAGKIRSYFVHFDGIGLELRRLMGSITFATPILGVIGRSLTLEQTDGSFGSPGTLYPTDRFNREGEYQDRGNYDYFEIGADQRTLSFRWEVSTDVDQLRVITAVPEPCSLVMIGAGTVLIATARRRQKRQFNLATSA